MDLSSKFSRLNLSTKLSWRSSVDKIHSMKFRWWNFDDNISSKEFIHRNSVDKINSMNRVFDELGSIRWNKNRYMAVIFANLKWLVSLNNKKIIRCKTESADARNHQCHREDLLWTNIFDDVLMPAGKSENDFTTFLHFSRSRPDSVSAFLIPGHAPSTLPDPARSPTHPTECNSLKISFFLQAGF